MSDPTQTAPVVPQFVDPPPMPAAGDSVQARMAQYGEVLKADPSRAGEIEQLARYQVETEAAIARDRAGRPVTSDESSAMSRQAQQSALERAHASMMQPPASDMDYQINVDPRDMEKPEIQAHVTGLRTAMFDAKLPTHIGNLLSQSLQEQSDRYRGMNFEAANAQIETDRAAAVDRLQGLWGDQFDGRVQRLQAFMLDMATKHPAVRDAVPMLQMNWPALAALSDLVEYRARR